MNNFEQVNIDRKASIRLSDCDISVRAFQALRSAGINTLGELSACTEEEIKSKIIATNSKTLQEIRELLRANGLSLRSE